MLDIVKYDMCTQSSKFIIEISSLIHLVHAQSDIIAFFKPCMLPTIYYIAGWHDMTFFKISKKRKGKLGDLIMHLFEQATIDRDHGMLLEYSGKVNKLERFGRL